jgi:hypothetical protein
MSERKDESVHHRTAKANSSVRSRTHRVVRTKTDDSSVAERKPYRSFNKFNDSRSSKANSSVDYQSKNKEIEKKIDAFFEANKESGLKKLVSASKLMEAGAHIGTLNKF